MVKKTLLVLLLVAGGLVAGLLLVELGFRVVTAFSSPRPQWSDRPPFYFQHEASPTLQDFPYAEGKPPGVFRVSVIGDSYSFAPFMQFTDAFPKVLERMLNLNASPLKAEVLNFGVPGYSTSHEIEKAEEALRRGSDLLLLQITLNDPELKPYRPTGIREFGRFGAFIPSPRQEMLFSWFTSWRFAAERLHNNRTRSEYTKYFNDLFSNPRSRRVFEDSVKQIVEKSQSASVPLVGVVFPLFGLPLDEEYPFHDLHRQVRALLRSFQVPVLDLYELYAGIPLERLQVIPGGDRHPNEIAHRMAAERIYQFLLGENLIPQELQIKRRFTGRTQILRETPYQDAEQPIAAVQ